jgi:uncharacterized protein (DUF1330 family)
MKKLLSLAVIICLLGCANHYALKPKVSGNQKLVTPIESQKYLGGNSKYIYEIKKNLVGVVFYENNNYDLDSIQVTVFIHNKTNKNINADFGKVGTGYDTLNIEFVEKQAFNTKYHLENMYAQNYNGTVTDMGGGRYSVNMNTTQPTNYNINVPQYQAPNIVGSYMQGAMAGQQMRLMEQQNQIQQMQMMQYQQQQELQQQAYYNSPEYKRILKEQEKAIIEEEKKAKVARIKAEKEHKQYCEKKNVNFALEYILERLSNCSSEIIKSEKKLVKSGEIYATNLIIKKKSILENIGKNMIISVNLDGEKYEFKF